MVLLVVFRYILAYDPRANPFDDKDENTHGQGRNAEIQCPPNPVDAKTVGWLNRRSRRPDREVWEKAMKKVSAGLVFSLCHLHSQIWPNSSRDFMC